MVTLAGLLAWQGFQLYVLGDTGTMNITNSKIIGLTSTFFSDAVGWIVAAIAIGAYYCVNLSNVRRRAEGGSAGGSDDVGGDAHRGGGRGRDRGASRFFNADRGLPAGRADPARRS